MRWTAVKYRRIVVAAFNSRTRRTAVHQMARYVRRLSSLGDGRRRQEEDGRKGGTNPGKERAVM